jgi:hypothetical protein
MTIGMIVGGAALFLLLLGLCCLWKRRKDIKESQKAPLLSPGAAAGAKAEKGTDKGADKGATTTHTPLELGARASRTMQMLGSDSSGGQRSSVVLMQAANPFFANKAPPAPVPAAAKGVAAPPLPPPLLPPPVVVPEPEETPEEKPDEMPKEIPEENPEVCNATDAEAKQQAIVSLPSSRSLVPSITEYVSPVDAADASPLAVSAAPKTTLRSLLSGMGGSLRKLGRSKRALSTNLSEITFPSLPDPPVPQEPQTVVDEDPVMPDLHIRPPSLARANSDPYGMHNGGAASVRMSRSLSMGIGLVPTKKVKEENVVLKRVAYVKGDKDLVTRRQLLQTKKSESGRRLLGNLGSAASSSNRQLPLYGFTTRQTTLEFDESQLEGKTPKSIPIYIDPQSQLSPKSNV